MKETRFIAQNKEKWREAETLLKSSTKDPEKLSNLFIQVVDDLSYSRTYYPNRSVRVYLNKIARQYFSIIASHKKAKHNQFKLFWLDELPQIIVSSRRPLIISLLVFILALSIGVFSSYKDPHFVNTILGDSYVTMTEMNIQNGDPMAVYKQSHEVDMFLGITFNNLMVAFRTYLLGIFLAIGTLASLLYNGIMVGCFQYFFIDRGLFAQSALSIWLHGTLEISSIILAGGAGLTLGSGLIFPGTYSRLQALQISGVRSLKLMLGITPVFVLAAIIESFLTRYTNAPTFLKLLLILFSGIYIIGYFVVYPWYKSKIGFQFPLEELRLAPKDDEPTNFNRIKTNAEILKDTFLFYSRNRASLLSWALVAALGVSAAGYLLEEPATIYLEEEWWIQLFSNMLAGLATPTPAFILINALGTTIILYRTMKLVDSEAKKEPFDINIKSLFQIFLVALTIYASIFMGVLGILLLIGSIGLLFFSSFVQLTKSGSLITGFIKGWELFGKNSNQGLTLQLIVTLLSFSFLLLLSTPLIYIHMNVLEWNFLKTDRTSQQAIHFLEMFIKVFSFYLVLPLMSTSLAYLYFSQDEVNQASDLKESIAKMAQRRSKIYRR